MINKEWNVGVHDRGHGHSSYAVLDDDGYILLEVGTDRDLCQHIVDLHNEAIKDDNSNTT